MQEYMTLKEATEKWEIGDRRINALCLQGRIEGDLKFGRQGLFHVMRKSQKMHVSKVVSIKRKDENIS